MKHTLMNIILSLILITCAFETQAQIEPQQQPNATSGTFPIVILIGRPAAGKSEVIDFLKNTSLKKREQDFHIGSFAQVDDFPFIWDWFAEDDILSRDGKKRLHTDSEYYFKDDFFWDVLIEKINIAVKKKLQENKEQHKVETIVIEFSRGSRSHGYQEAFRYLSPDILKQAAIIYVEVSYKESLRRNQGRAVKGMEGSVLHHSVPADKMEYYYKDDDWQQLTNGNTSGLLDIKGYNIPYSVLSNEPEVTGSKETLAPALKTTADKLWTISKR